MAELLWRLKWSLLVRRCRGCSDPSYHSYHLTALGRVRFTFWIWLEG